MLNFIALASAARAAVESIPSLGLLFAVPVAIIALATVATAIATFIDRQLPAGKSH
ncbi:MAG: hypothetical protein Q7O66_14320 [Dehalococcoidia bacterium]|nr:hypothetical protein [Dehalococcoidia bacterium]